MKTPLLGLNPDELKEVALRAGLPKYAGGQLAKWLYQRRAASFEEMTDIPKAGRETLAESYETGRSAPADVAVSQDGTKKYLFSTGEGMAVESVMIPDGDRKTLCVSSQAGCKMGCKFCMTGRQGFHGNLSAAEILNQFLSVYEAAELTGTVFMGMGEPLDNWENVQRALEVLTAPWGFAWSPKRVTLSTIGVLPNLRRFLEETKCHLAVSLHNPFPEQRAEMMGVEKAWSTREIMDLIRSYDFTGQRRVSFEYTMFGGWNDSARHADELARLLRGLECRVNLIRFHRIPDFPYESSSREVMEEFQKRLSSRGVTATIRASRGEDIFAACGLLAGKHNQNR